MKDKCLLIEPIGLFSYNGNFILQSDVVLLEGNSRFDIGTLRSGPDFEILLQKLSTNNFKEQLLKYEDNFDGDGEENQISLTFIRGDTATKVTVESTYNVFIYDNQSHNIWDIWEQIPMCSNFRRIVDCDGNAEIIYTYFLEFEVLFQNTHLQTWASSLLKQILLLTKEYNDNNR